MGANGPSTTGAAFAVSFEAADDDALLGAFEGAVFAAAAAVVAVTTTAAVVAMAL